MYTGREVLDIFISIAFRVSALSESVELVMDAFKVIRLTGLHTRA